MENLESRIRIKTESLLKAIKDTYGEDTLSNKQIIDLIVSIDPIISDLGKLLENAGIEDTSSFVEDARLVYEENCYLLDILISKVKQFH